MIRTIAAIALLIISLAALVMGQHPMFPGIGIIAGLSLIGWVCADKEEAGLLN